jgi:beta-lactamase class A
MPFFDVTKDSQRIGTALVDWTLGQFGKSELAPDRLALTLLPFHAPLRASGAIDRIVGFSYRGDVPFYPCSVIKAFYLAALEARIAEGTIVPQSVVERGELDRAGRDMIRWSSNTATNYIIDLVTGTTGDTLLDQPEMDAWVERRQWVNRYFRALGWPEAEAINVCQKLMDDERYGREKVFVSLGGNNHNRLTTEATARLFHAIFSGRMISPVRSRAMAQLFARPLEDAGFLEHPAAQIKGYFGAGLPAGCRIWSKAGWTGWTGDRDASYRRHDAAYVELRDGPAFILVVFTQGRPMSESQTVLPAIARRAAELVADFPIH